MLTVHRPAWKSDFRLIAATCLFNPANAPQSLKQEIFDALVYPPDVQGKWNKVDEFIKSGGTSNSGLAIGVDLPLGTELVKITSHVPNNPNLGPSAYWMTRDAFDAAKAHPTLDIEDFLGLPAQSHSIKYDVISVTTVTETRVYKSTIASTNQGTFARAGGGEQMIIPNVNSPSFGPRVLDTNYSGWMPE